MAVDRYPGSRSIPRYMQRAGDVLNTTSVKFEWFLVEHNNNNNNNNNLFGKFTPKRQVMALGNALINCLNYL